MPTTARDTQALTYLARRLREETHGANKWDEPGIHAVISRMAGQQLLTTIERVIAHSADPLAKTPGAIMRPFTPERGPQAGQHPPKRRDECPHHPGRWADNCGGCAADRLAADAAPPPSWQPADPDMTSGLLDAMRADIAAAKHTEEEA